MKLSKDEWLSAGLNTLAEYGPDCLKIDWMCKKLQVTKGSFYHHFQNRDNYIELLLAFWQEQNTQAIIAQVEDIKSLKDRSAALDAITTATDAKPERAFRSWAQTDEKVADFVKQVDLARIDYLEQLIGPQLQEEMNANLVAKIAYAHFVGAQQLEPVISKDEWRSMNELLRSRFTGSP